MICPHCRISSHDSPESRLIGEDTEGTWGVISRICPECKKLILHLASGEPIEVYGNFRGFSRVDTMQLIRPKGSQRPSVPVEVPKDIAEDYNEACIVLHDSPKASAALSRRCLQNLLREVAKVKSGDLNDEIDQVLKIGRLPSHLSEVLDAVRNIGNFATHPIKSKVSGEIVPVEPGEAEWNLDVLEGLFDFYFVQPAITAKKKAELNKKLASAGKKPLK